MDSELGIVVEQAQGNTPELYPFHKIENDETREVGSCIHYYTRVDVTEEIEELDLDDFNNK